MAASDDSSETSLPSSILALAFLHFSIVGLPFTPCFSSASFMRAKRAVLVVHPAQNFS